MSSGLLHAVFSTPEMESAADDRAWLQGMLDFEAGLARAQARAGVIPTAAAAGIAGCCDAGRLDLERIATEALQGGNPAMPLVRQLTAQVEESAAGYVHWGATSQDVIDTGSMLVLRRALPSILDDLAAVERHCARLAETHRDTVMPGRTLLQQALPITFGLKAAGWLSQVHRVRRDLARVHRDGLALQFGGAVGTLSALGERGEAVLASLATELDLAEPDLPWHGARDRITRVMSALGLTAGAVGKIALDVALLMQTEVAEAREPLAPGAGGSSTMPHKRNPVASTLALAAVRQVHGLMTPAFASALQEHERAAGAWHAEWMPLFDTLRLTAAAVRHVRHITEGLGVDERHMRENLERTHGVMMAEAAMMALAPHLGRSEAHELVADACRRALDQARPLAEVLARDERVTRFLDHDEIRATLEPANYLGSAGRFIERALAAARDGQPS